MASTDNSAKRDRQETYMKNILDKVQISNKKEKKTYEFFRWSDTNNGVYF